MSFFDKLKAKNGNAGNDPTAAADAELRATEAAEPSPADRELPSVNARAKGSKLTSWVAFGFIGLLGLIVIWQVNHGKDRKVVAAEKKEAADAKKNAVTGTLPPIAMPEKPPAPTEAGEPEPPAGAAPNGQVPAPAADPNRPPAPIGMESGGNKGGSANGQRPVGRDGKPILTPWEEQQQRRRLGAVGVKFDNANDEGNGRQQNSPLMSQGGRPNDPPGGAEGTGFGAQGGGGGGNDELSRSLSPTVTRGVMATRLADRNLMVAKGTFLDCALETRIDSTQPGMTSCILSKPVYSDNGKVLLMERGTKVVGQYQGGLKNGQARIFVLWTRVETTNGVLVNLDSPGTDALGASGMSGYVDTHFMERFGTAILLSLIDDAGNALTRQNNSNGQINFSNTTAAAQNMATEALKYNINIPPTLVKNHGEHINVYVARDLDFRSIYDLRTKQ